mmetsp:Transcript_26875/g.50712  ORF Transcript_26875/g.50712 Transcript_26875/m.50712 type:complete len:405 (+) Transcript_26875:38-1252(+)|eukprot:scaffold42779_cov191-Amphora_coffeaeformis.AAC.4
MSPAAATVASSTANTLLRQGLPYLVRNNPHGRTGQWILGTAGLVVGMIHVGGVTRLTQSGLSMTTWSPLGSLPPLTEAAWQAEFARYQQFPEWEQRKSMTLRDFQFIYEWEYGHRMMGRFIGIAFTLPWIYFTVKRKIPTGYQARMLGLWTMGGMQGVVGWWMVKSGLGEDRRGDKGEIRVQPVRLAAHLSMAMATYGALVWTGLDILALPHNKQGHLVSLVESLSHGSLKALGRLRAGSWLLTGLTAATIASGALVAGNDAGRAYNSWPAMNGQGALFVVPEAWPVDKPLFWTVTKDTPTVQGNHRLLASATALTGLGVLGAVAASGPALGAALTPQVRNGLMAVGITVLGQYSLGVVTLLNYAPISLAAAHQVGSLAVFTSGLYLAHSLRYASRRVVKQVIR